MFSSYGLSILYSLFRFSLSILLRSNFNQYLRAVTVCAFFCLPFKEAFAMRDLLPTLSYFFRGPVAPRFACRRLVLVFVSSMVLALPTQRTT